MDNPVLWFTELETNNQKELCDKYDINPREVSIDAMDKMFAGEHGEKETEIELYYVVNKSSNFYEVRVYNISENKPSRLLTITVSKGKSVFNKLTERIKKDTSYKNFRLKLL